MMATVIDALIVTLGLDSSKFKKGSKDVTEEMKKQKKESEKLAKDMQEAGKRAAGFFTAIRTEVIALAGVSLSLYGVKSFVTEMTQGLTKLSVASKALDLTPKQLEGWTGAAEAVGSSSEKITGVIGNFQKLVNTFRGGGDVSNNPLKEVLGGIEGVIGKKFDLKTMSGADIVQIIMENWDKFSKDAQRKVGSDIGFDDAIIQSAAEKGEYSFLNLKRKFEDQSKATNSLGDDARKLRIQFVELERSFAAAGQTLYKAMLPYVVQLPPLLEKIGTWISTHGPEIEEFFHDAADSVNGVVDAVGGWQNALEVLLAFMVGKWVLGMVGAITKVSASAGGLSGALADIGKGAARAGIAGATVFSAYEFADWVEKNSGPKTRLSKNGMYYEDSWVGQATSWVNENFVSGGNLSEIPMSPQQQAAKDAIASAGFPAFLSQPRGIRNNNPGNLNFAGQNGAVKEGGENGRFAVFQSMQHGVAALYKQLQLYFRRGVNTLSAIVNKYAPAGDNNNVGAYIAALSKATGLGANDTISAGDTATIARLMKGIVDHENGKGYVSTQDIMGGIQLGSSGVSARANQQQTSNKTEIHIGEMSVQSNATSLRALGDDVSSATRRNGLVMAYSSGQ